jgi:methionyl-tRNA synthetase
MEEENKKIKEVKEVENKSNKITIDDLAKVEIRVGQIKSATPVEGSEKLLILKVDFGNEERQIVSGIAKYFSPESLIDKKVPFVTNLEPRKLMGHESNGMIFAAKDSAGHFSLLDVSVDIENGTFIS